MNKYHLNSYDDKDFRYNYLFVAIKSDTCLESVNFKKIKKKQDKYELIFNDKLYCGRTCVNEVIIYEIQIDKNIRNIDSFDVVNCHDLNDDMVVKKPVLYLYPEEDMNVKVTFENKNTLLSTYPKYKDEWNVFVKKDGTLIDKNGREYYALYWDENINHKEKFKTGFYVKSKNSIKFLEEKLFEMGFTDKEANEFIMYWLPIMEHGGDNLVHFHFTEDRQKQSNKGGIYHESDRCYRKSAQGKRFDAHRQAHCRRRWHSALYICRPFGVMA